MHVSLIPHDLRSILFVAIAGLGTLAFFLRTVGHKKPAFYPWASAVAALAMLCALAILTDVLVTLTAGEVAPQGSAYNNWRWLSLAPWGWPAITLAVAALVGTLVFAWHGTRRAHARPIRRAVLFTLRAGTCAAALILFLAPALELRHVTRKPNHIAMLVDNSRSMQLSERPGHVSRQKRAARIIEKSTGTLEKWRKHHRVQFFTFSDRVVASSEGRLKNSSSTALADATLLREALKAIRRRYEGDELAGIVVISDGVATGQFGAGAEDGSALDFLAKLDSKVHTVWAGDKGLRDYAVTQVFADDFAFVRTAIKIEASIRATGFRKKKIPVVLKRDGQVIKKTEVVVGGDKKAVRASFAFVPQRVDKFVYEISILVDKSESVKENNRKAFVLNVIRDKIRVLQIAGRPSWDERAMRGLLKADPNVDLISFFILRTNSSINPVPSNEMSLIRFPTEELFEDELDSFDLILFQNFGYQPVNVGRYLENIRQYVENGGAIAMLGGDQTFSSGNYLGTPVADALPVELLPRTYVPAAAGFDGLDDRFHIERADPLVSSKNFQPQLSADGKRHPITRLRFGNRDNLRRWQTLPKLQGLNLVRSARRKATVLLEHPTLNTNTGDPMPVLAVSSYGKGRALSFLTDTSWHWGLVAAGRPGDDGRAYQQFWDNAIRWLIRDPELEHLQVQSDRTVYPVGERPHLAVRLVDKDYRPKQGAAVQLLVKRERGRGSHAAIEHKLTTDESGEATLELATSEPGVYRVTARAKSGDQNVSANDVFLISEERTELAKPESDPATLEAIAGATGGEYLGRIDSLPSDLGFAPPRIVRLDRRMQVEIWSRPALLFIALLFLGLEWALRRRGGWL